MKIEISPTNEFVAFDDMIARIWRGTTDRGTRCVAIISRIGLPDDAPEDECQQLLEMSTVEVEIAHPIERLRIDDPKDAN